MSVEMISL